MRARAFARQCPDHPEANLVEDHAAGDLICPECGLVVGDRVVDVRSEWRSFSDSDKKSSSVDPNRVGAAGNPLLGGQELTTIISSLPGAGREASSLQKMNARTALSGADRSMLQAFRRISQMAARVRIADSIVQRANRVFKDVTDTKALRGRSHESIAAACLYIACRQESVPRTFKEICAISQVPKRDIGRCYKLILQALETNLDMISTSDFMSRFCNKLSLPRKIQEAARTVAKRANEDFGVTAGKSPISVAAAAIFMVTMASGTPCPVADICDVSGVAEGTVRTSYREMYPIKEHLLPPDVVSQSLSTLPNYGPPQSHGVDGLSKVESYYERLGQPVPSVVKSEPADEIAQPAASLAALACPIKTEII